MRRAQCEEDLVREALDLGSHSCEPRRVIDLGEPEERGADVARIAGAQPERFERITTEAVLHVEQELACTKLIGTHRM